MRNVSIVAGFEIRSLLSRPSFWLLTVLFPLFIMALTFGGQLMVRGGGGGMEQAALEAAGVQAMPQVAGYVDLSGLIQSLPPDMPGDQLRSFATEGDAQGALAREEIAYYFIVPADFVETGEMILVQEEFEPFGNTNEGLMQAILNYNLIGDAQRMSVIGNPLGQVNYHPLAAPLEAPETLTPTPAAPAAPRDPLLATLVPLAAVMLLFFVLVMSSGYMLRSVSREKENRTVEVLLLSLRPRQLMLGKILGLSVVALVQMGLWLAAGIFFLNRGSGVLQMVGSVQLPPSFIGWVIVYVILGYLLYASLMGALGALAPSAREGNQFSFFVLLPLIIPIWLNGFLIAAPNGTMALVLSLFPLTAPPAMIARLAATEVPFWQPALSVAGLAITTYLVILLSARFFRADTLLSSAAINWRRVVQATGD
ncbi:MAG: ABC transporter permease [Caldilineaceae bacterium]|nr:ABC transporter permease [Caldilineaceae bacterium]